MSFNNNQFKSNDSKKQRLIDDENTARRTYGQKDTQQVMKSKLEHGQGAQVSDKEIASKNPYLGESSGLEIAWNYIGLAGNNLMKNISSDKDKYENKIKENKRNIKYLQEDYKIGNVALDVYDAISIATTALLVASGVGTAGGAALIAGKAASRKIAQKAILGGIELFAKEGAEIATKESVKYTAKKIGTTESKSLLKRIGTSTKNKIETFAKKEINQVEVKGDTITYVNKINDFKLGSKQAEFDSAIKVTKKKINKLNEKLAKTKNTAAKEKINNDIEEQINLVHNFDQNKNFSKAIKLARFDPTNRHNMIYLASLAGTTVAMVSSSEESHKLGFERRDEIEKEVIYNPSANITETLKYTNQKKIGKTAVEYKQQNEQISNQLKQIDTSKLQDELSKELKKDVTKTDLKPYINQYKK